MVLVDTSVWSIVIRRNVGDLSREQNRYRSLLTAMVAEGRIVMIGVVRQELLSGVRSEDQFQRVREYLRRFDDSALEAEDYEEAARIHNICRSRGVNGSAGDFLICAVALRRDWQVFTLDKDFERYAKHVPLALYRPA